MKKEKDILIMGRELAGIVWASTSEKYYLIKKLPSCLTHTPTMYPLVLSAQDAAKKIK